jgi:hypothetical protein
MMGKQSAAPLACLLLLASAGVSEAQTLGPDGSYVAYGPCTLCPDGRYIGGGGQCQLAPDGSYVPGTPRGPQLAPDGTYHPSGPLTLCPDGSYVAGRQCVLMPNGTYVGR